MAWRSTAASNAELVANLEANSFVVSPVVRSALLATDRALYVPDSEPGPSQTYDYGPYADAPQSIGHKVTISAPHVHALALEALRPLLVRDGCRALDVGCGSGVLLACMARMGAAPSDSRSLRHSSSSIALAPRRPRRIRSGDGRRARQRLDGAAAHALRRDPRRCRRAGGAGGAARATGGRRPHRHPIGDREQQTLVVEKAADGGRATALQRKRALSSSLPSPPVPDGSVDYDERYCRGWAYGKEATAFVAEAAASHLPAGRPLKVLSLAEGQGRHAVHLATLGHACTAVDRSRVGLAKASRLAEERGVHIDTVEADLAEYEPAAGGASWDVILAVFCALPPDVRQRLHRACAAALRPGGVFLFEDFAPTQAVRRAAEGPCWIAGLPAEWLVDADALAADFGALEIVVRRETVEERLVEGRFHRGRAALTQLVARRARAGRRLPRARRRGVEEAIDGGGDGGDGGEVDLHCGARGRACGSRAPPPSGAAAADTAGWSGGSACARRCRPRRRRRRASAGRSSSTRASFCGRRLRPARRPPRRRRAHRLRRRVPRGTARRALSGAGGRARPFSGATGGDGGRVTRCAALAPAAAEEAGRGRSSCPTARGRARARS